MERFPKEKKGRKYVAIAKVDSNKFVKYRTNHPDQCIKFLHSKFPLLRFVNFFYRRGVNARMLYATYGTKKGFELAK